MNPAGYLRFGDYFFFREDFFFLGILAPAFRASDRPIAIACLRLLTVLPERPLFSLPRFILCIARSTFRLPLFCLAAMMNAPFAATVPQCKS
jgi:hypothetical protein